MDNFNLGDVIDFCGERYMVLKNYGNSGEVVEVNNEGGIFGGASKIGNFYWRFEGANCTFVRKVSAEGYYPDFNVTELNQLLIAYEERLSESARLLSDPEIIPLDKKGTELDLQLATGNILKVKRALLLRRYLNE